MRPTTWTGLGMLAFVAVVVGSRPIGLVQTMAAQAGGTTARQMPQFQVDPAWPKLPSKWVLGLVSNVAVDAQDHVWVLQRPNTVRTGMAAPPVLEFDAAGNFVQGWGGPGAGYEWPEQEHGIAFDQKGNLWLAGSDRKDSQLLKFTRDGKFVMQIGHKGQSKGNADTQNTHGAADVAFYAKNNEIFVADGYFNRRVIVFDADTGRFKRMWGAFGNAPTDPVGDKSPAADLAGDGAGPDQFNLVHSVRISNDGFVYVTDRANRRVQVFTPEGKYIKQAFVSRHYVPPSTLSGMAFGKPIRELVEASLPGGSALGTAFSVDKEQRFLYVADRIRSQVAVLDRGSLEILGYFGDGLGPAPGQFYVLHDIAADSKGNLYTAEVNELGNKRAQKFVYKGIAAAPSTR